MTQRSRVLVVDDEPAIVTLLRDFLEGEGFDVVTAHDGVEALSVLGREVVDCVVLDIMMPGPSGFDVCRQVRATSEVPIVFLTAREDASDKIRGFRLGADDYVTNPSASKSSTSALTRRCAARSKRCRRRANNSAAPAAAAISRRWASAHSSS